MRVKPGTPSASSYDDVDVTHLLTDLTGVVTPLPGWRRDALIRAGLAPAGLLTAEEPPDDEALQLYGQALTHSARAIARAVGLAAERILATTPVPPVLVSLARAGTPAGILLRRWMLWRHGSARPHYTLSLVRGWGMDHNALRHVLERCDARAVRFVDGWTGKGAIARELRRSLAEAPMDPGLVALVDPGHYAAIRGTDDDVLVPTASLNATGCGLLGGIVVRPSRGPDDFHGAIWHPELATRDRSTEFVDAVCRRFAEVREEVDDRAGDRPAAPTPRAATAVTALADAYGVADPNLVKAGVNETVRAFFYRRPRLLLLADRPGWPLSEILRMARRRGVPVERLDSNCYDCVCIIDPAGAY